MRRRAIDQRGLGRGQLQVHAPQRRAGRAAGLAVNGQHAGAHGRGFLGVHAGNACGQGIEQALAHHVHIGPRQVVERALRPMLRHALRQAQGGIIDQNRILRIGIYLMHVLILKRASKIYQVFTDRYYPWVRSRCAWPAKHCSRIRGTVSRCMVTLAKAHVEGSGQDVARTVHRTKPPGSAGQVDPCAGFLGLHRSAQPVDCQNLTSLPQPAVDEGAVPTPCPIARTQSPRGTNCLPENLSSRSLPVCSVLGIVCLPSARRVPLGA